MKKILSVLFVLVVIFYFFQLYRATVNYAQTENFADENDHMIGGYFISKGKQLYKDMSVVHQPLSYYLSATVQKLTKSNSIFLFVKHQREMVWAYSLFWNVLYFVFFGKILLIFTLIFELSKYWFLGNLVLAESLAVYPLVFLFGMVIKKCILDSRLRPIDVVAFSIATFTAVFLLLQIWPAIFALNLILLIANRKEKRLILWQIVPFLILTGILFLVVPFSNYVQEVFIYNFRYYFPVMDKINTQSGYIKMALLPFTSFHSNPNSMELITIILLITYLLLAYAAWKNKKLLAFLLIVLCLVISNTRDNTIGFTNFHLLPWIGSFIFIPIMLFPLLIKKTKKFPQYLSVVVVVGIFLGIVLYINTIAKTPFNDKKNVMTENDINYHDINKYGLAIRAVKSPGDRLISMSGNLIHVVSETDLITRQIHYYTWQYSIPGTKERLLDIFQHDPPEFFVAETIRSFPQFIKPYVISKYVQVYHQGKLAGLFILKSKVKKITEKQWENFEFYLFQRVTGI